jgi:hypothetical protein
MGGHLLLQTVEEDAFWTFVALMDRHLRGYFSPTARLLEVDSLLFERAVITFDKPLASRLFVRRIGHSQIRWVPAHPLSSG